MLRNRRVVAFIVSGLAVLGLVSGLATGASSSDSVAYYDVTLTPNWVSPDDSASDNLQAVWLYGTSPTTPYRSPDSYNHVGRYLLLDPRATDADGRRGNDDWWFVIQRYWPASYPASSHGNWGTEVNFHNVAGDAGPSGGVGWGFGTGVSSLMLAWPNGDSSPIFNVEPNTGHTEFPLPNVTRDAWHTYVVHFVAGRTDGSTVHPGALTVWADGADQPAINVSNINTLQRAKGPDGSYYTQRWMQLWEGDYTQNLPTVSRLRLALTRIGTSLSQAVADRPTLLSDNVGNQFYRGSGANVGAPSERSVGTFAASTAAVPANLGGSGAAASPPPATSDASATSTASTTTTTTATSTTAKPSGRKTTTTNKTTTTTSPASGGTAAPQGGARKKGGGSSGRRGAAPPDAAGSSPAATVRWDGRTFSDWWTLRSYVSNKGVEPNEFLVDHPSLVATFGLQDLRWDSQTFYVRRSFTRYLQQRGVEVGVWQMRHPNVLSRLSG